MPLCTQAKAGQINDEERDIMIQQQAKLLLMEQELANSGGGGGGGSSVDEAAASVDAAPFAPAVAIDATSSQDGEASPREAGGANPPPESPALPS